MTPLTQDDVTYCQADSNYKLCNVQYIIYEYAVQNLYKAIKKNKMENNFVWMLVNTSNHVLSEPNFFIQQQQILISYYSNSPIKHCELSVPGYSTHFTAHSQ
jgi:hypothetical protein